MSWITDLFGSAFKKSNQSSVPVIKQHGPFDADTEVILIKLHPLFKDMVRGLLENAEDAGLKIGLFEGIRSLERCAQLYAQGRDVNGNVIDPKQIVTNSKPGYSWHNYGLAVDIVMDGSDKPGLQASWKEAVDANSDKINDWTQMGGIGEQLGLTWGGHFKSAVDLPHFQFTGNLTIEQAFDLNKQGGLPAIWEKIT